MTKAKVNGRSWMRPQMAWSCVAAASFGLMGGCNGGLFERNPDAPGPMFSSAVYGTETGTGIRYTQPTIYGSVSHQGKDIWNPDRSVLRRDLPYVKPYEDAARDASIQRNR
jgi:hypothetical protein